MNDKPAYQALARERERLQKALAVWPPVLRGSIRQHGNRCGNLNCRCHDPKTPKLHGPYYYLSHRYQNKTQTVFLTATKLWHTRQWIGDYKRLIQTVYRLSEVNFQLLRYHHNRLVRRS